LAQNLFRPELDYTTKLEPISSRTPPTNDLSLCLADSALASASLRLQRLEDSAFPSYRRCTPFAFLRRNAQGLAELQVFAPHPRPVASHTWFVLRAESFFEWNGRRGGGRALLLET